jgi:hypothetical protein
MDKAKNMPEKNLLGIMHNGHLVLAELPTFN